MSVSPAEPPWSRRFVPALIAAVLVTGALGAPVAATDHDTPKQPLRLVPPATLAPATAPVPGHSVIETSVQSRTQGSGQRGGDIEINPLDEIAPDSIGTLDPGAGGFGVGMWKGSERQVVTRLLRLLPDNMTSRTMRSLARRLLTSIATPPAGPFEASGDERASLLALRLERLMALGEVPQVNGLLALVPSRHDDEIIARTRVDALLLVHDTTEACRLVRNGIAVYHQDPYWQKAMALCQMLAGEVDQMMLGLDLLRERGGADDPLFFALAGAAFGAEAEIPTGTGLTPLHLAMMQAVGAPLPAGSVERLPSPLLVAIAQAPNVDLERRAEAAESACAMGLLDGAALARVYGAFSFTPEELASAISAAESLEGPRRRALLYQAARGQSLPASRAEILRVALEGGARDRLYQALVPAYLPLLTDISITPELAWFASTAGRAFYAAGRYEQASAWLMLGRQEAIINPQATTAATSLWPYSRLAGGAAFTTEGNLAAWRAMREGLDEGAGAKGAGDEGGRGDALGQAQTLLRAEFQALGERDPLSWSLIAAQGQPASQLLPDAALLYALDEASESRRLGETVLLSLIVLGEHGPGASHTFALSAVLAALGRIGLEAEARALAIEAALAHGI
jgi:hypothetical protein